MLAALLPVVTLFWNSERKADWTRELQDHPCWDWGRDPAVRSGVDKGVCVQLGPASRSTRNGGEIGTLVKGREFGIEKPASVGRGSWSSGPSFLGSSVCRDGEGRILWDCAGGTGARGAPHVHL